MDRTQSRPWVVAAPVAFAALVVYVTTVCPTVPFGDGGELISAAASLGVAHPPGYPLYTLLGWVALQIPLGEPALRMNLLSALFGALACGALAWFLVRVTGSAVAASAGALALAVSSTMWKVSTVTEVYTLHLFLAGVLLGASWLVGSAGERPTREVALLVSGVALGLGLAHHPTIVLVLPAALVLAAAPPAGRPGAPRLALPAVRPVVSVAAVAAAVVIPLVLYWTLMLRARAEPAANWGRVTTLDALVPHVTAIAYRHLDLGWAGALRGTSWKELGVLFVAAFTPAIWPLALLGLAGRPVSEDSPRWARVRLAAGLLIAASVLFSLRYVTGDVEVFYLPAFFGIAVAAGLGIAQLLNNRWRFVRVAGIAAAVIVVLLPALWNARSRNLSGMTAAADYARDILATVPVGGVLIVETDDAFMIQYLHQVLKERPDVTIYDRSAQRFRSVGDDIAVEAPPGESGLPYRRRLELALIDREGTRDRPREILFAGWPGYELPEPYRLEPTGLLFRVRQPGGGSWDVDAIWESYHEQTVLDHANRTGDAFALAVAATYSLARGERALFEGDRRAADRAFDEAGRVGATISGIHRYIGTVYGRIGDYDRAIAAFERALAIKPSSTATLNNLGMAYWLSGNVPAAIEAYERSLDLVPGQGDAINYLRRLRQPRR